MPDNDYEISQQQADEIARRRSQIIQDPNAPILTSYDDTFRGLQYTSLLIVVTICFAIVGIVFTIVKILSKIFNNNNKL